MFDGGGAVDGDGQLWVLLSNGIPCDLRGFLSDLDHSINRETYQQRLALKKRLMDRSMTKQTWHPVASIIASGKSPEGCFQDISRAADETLFAEPVPENM